MTPTRTRLRHTVLLALAALGCGLVFMAYLRPELVIDLGNRLGTCFG